MAINLAYIFICFVAFLFFVIVSCLPFVFSVFSILKYFKMILSKETEMAGLCKLEENPGKSVVTESKGKSILKRREANYGKCFYEVL